MAITHPLHPIQVPKKEMRWQRKEKTGRRQRRAKQ